MPSHQTEVVLVIFLPLIRQEWMDAKYCAVMQIISIHRYHFMDTNFNSILLTVLFPIFFHVLVKTDGLKKVVI
jgi:hypothetical protein